MRYFKTIVFGFVLVCSAPTLLSAAPPDASNPPQPQILVTGEGTVSVAPDIAQVRGGVSTRASTVKEAADTNSRTMTAIIGKLVDAGIDRKDIQTAQFSIQPVYAASEPRSEQKLVGYSVSNQVVAKIRNVAIADAQRKADLYAKAAGVALGPVVSITEEGASAPAPVLMKRTVANGMAPPIAAGEDTLRVNVSVGFALAR
jgi:uncharacterized protein